MMKHEFKRGDHVRVVNDSRFPSDCDAVIDHVRVDRGRSPRYRLHAGGVWHSWFRAEQLRRIEFKAGDRVRVVKDLPRKKSGFPSDCEATVNSVRNPLGSGTRYSIRLDDGSIISWYEAKHLRHVNTRFKKGDRVVVSCGDAHFLQPDAEAIVSSIYQVKGSNRYMVSVGRGIYGGYEAKHLRHVRTSSPLPFPWKIESVGEVVSLKIQGETYVLAGTFSQGRRRVKEMIKSAGGSVSTNVSAKTNSVVMGGIISWPCTKVETAMKLKIPIISEGHLKKTIRGDFNTSGFYSGETHTDVGLLKWIFDRMLDEHGEDGESGYMRRFKKIIEGMGGNSSLVDLVNSHPEATKAAEQLARLRKFVASIAGVGEDLK